ncbi:MAG: peptide deformylase [Candidatus Moranbacteria bacterium]|nr:peptide deformylase [Candidatus Moranbacteria bacterium]
MILKTMLPIVTGEHQEVLHRHAARVAYPTTPEMRALIPEMIEVMRKADGVGLAAPQIGKSISLCVIEINGIVSAYFNPKIVTASEEKVIFEEGCLSLPGEFFPIERHEKITIRYDDISGKSRKLTATGFMAIVLQHEIDHLEGTLIIDRYRKQDNKNTYAL